MLLCLENNIHPSKRRRLWCLISRLLNHASLQASIKMLNVCTLVRSTTHHLFSKITLLLLPIDLNCISHLSKNCKLLHRDLHLFAESINHDVEC
ncbi:hypothetical protein GIB67_005865, partial [Kingdonia uniflora]